jgi:hypothetical protein
MKGGPAEGKIRTAFRKWVALCAAAALFLSVFSGLAKMVMGRLDGSFYLFANGIYDLAFGLACLTALSLISKMGRAEGRKRTAIQSAVCFLLAYEPHALTEKDAAKNVIETFLKQNGKK